MNPRKTGDKFITLTSKIEFKTEEDARKFLDDTTRALINTLRYQAKKNSWSGQIIIIGTIYNSKTVFNYKTNCIDGYVRRGRPIIKSIKIENKRHYTPPHLHILLSDVNPCSTVSKEIGKYWSDRYGEKQSDFRDVYCKEGVLGYMESQYMVKKTLNI